MDLEIAAEAEDLAEEDLEAEAVFQALAHRKSTRKSVQIASRIAKCHSSRLRAGQFIAKSAMPDIRSFNFLI